MNGDDFVTLGIDFRDVMNSTPQTDVSVLDEEKNDQLATSFRSLRDEGVPSNVLYSLATLICKHSKTKSHAVKPATVSFVPTTTTATSSDDNDLRVVASYLRSSSSDATQHPVKLACVCLLMTELLPPVAGRKEEDVEVIEDTLEYILGRDFGWNQPVHAELDLFVKLREACRRCQEEERRAELAKKETVKLVVRGGEVAAEAISGTAKAIETGLKWSVPVINSGIDLTGTAVKYMIAPADDPDRKSKDAVIATVYTDAAKRATNGVRVSARSAAYGIRDASTRGITMAARKFEEEQLGEKLVPDQDQREVLVAAGKVGIASLGAVGVVAEAVYDTTKAVAQKTASVTADVVRHKYGDSAGRLVQDASDTTGNILRTVAHVTMLERRILTKAVATNTGKVQIRQEGASDKTSPRQLEEEPPSSERQVSELPKRPNFAPSGAVPGELKKRRTFPQNGTTEKT